MQKMKLPELFERQLILIIVNNYNCIYAISIETILYTIFVCMLYKIYFTSLYSIKFTQKPSYVIF